jgi:hypothetical protein
MVPDDRDTFQMLDQSAPWSSGSVIRRQLNVCSYFLHWRQVTHLLALAACRSRHQGGSMKYLSYVLAALATIAFAIPSIASAEDAKPMAMPMKHHHHHYHHHHAMKPMMDKKM